MDTQIDFLTKLAAEVPNGKPGESKPEGSKPEPEKKDGKKPGVNPFAKSKDDKSGKSEDKKGTPNNEQKPNEKGNGFKKAVEPGSEGEKPVAGEKEIEGNESAEGPAVPGTGNVDPKIVFDFLAQNPAPNDEAFHEFAESQGLDIHAAESIAYALAGKFVQFLRGGKSQGMDPNSVDPQQLKLGIQIESEHSPDPTTCKKIAMDHLAENGQYYTILQKMEGGSEGDQQQKPPGPKNEKGQIKGQQVDQQADSTIQS